MPIARINGFDLYYEREGDGLAIALIHGGYGGAASSVLPREEPWVGSFTDSYTVVTYDRRSAGRSEYPDSEHTLEVFASDLRELLRLLGVERAFIVGSSAGGPISINYTLAYPETVIGLVLANTSARMWRHEARVATAETLRQRIQSLERHGPEATFDLIQQQQKGDSPLLLAPGGSGPRPRDRARALEERNRRVQALVNGLDRADQVRYTIGELRNQAAYVDSDLTPRLREIRVPTLVVHGDSDLQVPYYLGVEMSEEIAGAELVTVPGAGHGVMQWKVGVEAIRSFCDGIRVSAG